MIFLNYLLKPRSTKPSEAFRERAIRIIVFIALIFFSILQGVDVFVYGISGIFFSWYIFIYLIIILIYTMLQLRQINWAARLLIPAMLLIIIDSSAAYWSPGTVLMGMAFTFMFQLLLENFPERFLALFINLGIYTYLALSTVTASPLNDADYFSRPITAILTVYMLHAILIGVIHVIRQQQALQNQHLLLLEQHRVDVLRQFLGHSSHDLRTLLTRLSNGLYLAKMKLPESEHDSLARLEDASKDMQKLVLNMLEMAKLQDLKLDFVDISVNDIIQDVIHSYHDHAKHKSQTIQYDKQATNIYICADIDYIHRALGNVLENAIQYSPEGNSIDIKTSTTPQAIMIDIIDYGSGIAPEHLPHIFDSFYRGDIARNQARGLNGLGLSISKKIIELHNGKITVDSISNEGSRFTITLPRY